MEPILLFEYDKKTNATITKQIATELPDIDMVEVNSFDTDTMVQVLIPLAAILAPVISPIIIKLIRDKNVTIKFDGIEASGRFNEVRELIEMVRKKSGDD